MMEENKTIFNYISQMFATFGIIVTIFIIFSLVIGESSGDYSTLFALGKTGLTLGTLAQLLLLAFIITVAQVAFMTDVRIKNMSVVLRNVLFFSSIMAAIVVMVILCGWFPINDIKAWIGFVVSYVVCMVLSVLVSKLRERAENAKMQEALDKYKNH